MTWFIHHDEKILGPFSTEKILAGLKEGEISYSAYIWSKGQVEWLAISEWESQLTELSMAADGQSHLWQLRTPSGVQKDLKFQQVLGQLKIMENFKLVSVSPNDEENWAPVYSSYPFMEALNISRRNFLRAPLMGLTKVTREDSRFSYVVKTSTIGQGGIGLYGLGPNFEPGTHVQLKIESEDLATTVNVSGIVVYNTDQGFVGVRFGNLQAESQAVIIDYMKRFHDEDVVSNQKAS